MTILQDVAGFIQREGLLQGGQALVAAVSGGPDSLCLLDCLHRLGYPLHIAHLDHGLRPESPSEATFVQGLADQYGLPISLAKADLSIHAAGGASLEEAARLARYRFLVRVAKEHGYSVIATGHTADDQAETVLMHLLRGAGPSGLRGMRPLTMLDDWVGIPDSEELTLIRPLLSLTRAQTRAYCDHHDLNPVHDPSNLDPTFFRNRLRHHLIPILETYNPKIRQVLNRTAQVMAAEADWLTAAVREAWPTLVRSAGENALALDVAPFLQTPLALQRALLRAAIKHLLPEQRDIGYELVARALDFMHAGSRGKQIDLVGGLQMLHLHDEALLYLDEENLHFPQFPQLAAREVEELTIPGKLELRSGWMLEATRRRIDKAAREFLREGHPEDIATMDADSLNSSLSVRPRKPGDTFRPLGMKGNVKVADFFINQHIPRPARLHWPLVISGSRIVWVVGLRMSEEVRITAESKEAVVVRIMPPGVGE